MKRIFILILFFATTFNLSAQINSFFIQGINCYNDTAFIALDVNSLFIQWDYKDAGVWMTSSNYSFINVNTAGDTLKTTQCGKYRSTVWYIDGGGNYSNEIDSFVLVIKAGSTIKDSLKRALKNLKTSNFKITGVVLNSISKDNSADSYYYYYQYYHDYYGDKD